MAGKGKINRRLLVFMLWVVTHPKTVLLAALIALLVSMVSAYFLLGLSINQDELFSSKVAFFKNYINFTLDFPENQATYVMIEAADPAHPPAVARWIEIASAITASLAGDTTNVRAVDSHVPLEQLGKQGILFEDPAQVKQDFKDFQELSIPFRPRNFLNRQLGDIPLQRFFGAMQSRIGQNKSGEDKKVDPSTADFAAMMATGMTRCLTDTRAPIQLGRQVPDLAQLANTDPSKLGYYYVEDQENPKNHLLLVRVFEKANLTSRNGLSDALAGVRGDVQQAASPFKDFKVNLTGRPVLEADEMATTDRDARLSEIAALTAVFVGLVLLLRSFKVAIFAEIALLVGIGWTFGWATISVHRLNLLSMVFLIALTGIGMDYLIQVLTRYRRESARRSSPRGIWTGVFKYVAAPINTACLGAAGAFFVSIFTNFRGAAELGIVASGGLLLCLLTGYVILPPLLTLFPAKPRYSDAEHRSATKQPSPIDPVPKDAPQPARPAAGSRWRHLWLAPPIVWAVLLMLGIPFEQKAKFDPSLLKMQAQSLPSVQLVHKLQTWSAAVLVPQNELDKLRQVRDAVAGLPTVQSTESILTAYDNYKWLSDQQATDIDRTDYEPVKVANLPELIASTAELGRSFRLTNPPYLQTADAMENLSRQIAAADPATAAERLAAWQQVFIEQVKTLLAPFRPAELNVSTIPASLRSHLQGVDGQFVLYINPRQDLWKQSNLRDFVQQVETAVADKVPDAPPVTGVAIDVYHSTSSIEKSFYHAAGYALALIFFLVLIDLRNISQTLLAISVLAMGLPMLVALMGLFHIDWNFANFFGLPILIGAGHEYGVFMVHRYNEACADPHRRWRSWDVSDKALLLCGYVTSVSFGFFWLLGHHEGLKSLGLVMALGTACIYLATLCVLRPLLLWKLAKRDASCKS
jgi:predicted RND superfamily exporter protein